MEYKLVNCSIWLIFLLKFQLVGKSIMSIHNEDSTTNDTKVFLAKFHFCLNSNQKFLPSVKVEVDGKGVNFN